MTEVRTEENDKFKTAKEDDLKVIEILEEAIEALSGYYKKNKIEMGKVQGPGRLLQVTEGKQPPPDARFSDKGKRKNESKGIISILTMLKEDLEDEIKNGVKDEAAAQKEYEKQMEAAKKLLEELHEKKSNLEEEKANAEEKKEDEESKLTNNKEALQTNEDYRKEIEPDCDWMLEKFSERVEKRNAELKGLRLAKDYLSGAKPPTREDKMYAKAGYEGFVQEEGTASDFNS